MPQRPLVDILRAAVGEVAPDELSDLDDAVRAYTRDPPAAWRARDGAATYSGPAPAVPALALAVAVDLARNPLLPAGHRSGRLAALWARLRGRDRVDLQLPPPAVRDFDAARLEAAATLAGKERGADDERAAAVGAALLRHWPRT